MYVQFQECIIVTMISVRNAQLSLWTSQSRFSVIVKINCLQAAGFLCIWYIWYTSNHSKKVRIDQPWGNSIKIQFKSQKFMSCEEDSLVDISVSLVELCIFLYQSPMLIHCMGPMQYHTFATFKTQWVLFH